MTVNDNLTVNDNATVNQLLTVNRGVKLVVQGYQNGGTGRGIYMWTKDNTKWGIYMGQPGHGRALDGSAAVAGHGFNSHAIRFRVNDASNNGFIWENSNDELLMSLNGGSGMAYIKGQLRVEGGVLGTDYSMGAKANWPDYVFADDYALKPLAEVETFIHENSHLPEVPSAQEVGTKGYDLHEMNVALLQKVEELTLYTIEQQKQLDDLKTELQAMRVATLSIDPNK